MVVGWLYAMLVISQSMIEAHQNYLMQHSILHMLPLVYRNGPLNLRLASQKWGALV